LVSHNKIKAGSVIMGQLFPFLMVFGQDTIRIYHEMSPLLLSVVAFLVGSLTFMVDAFDFMHSGPPGTVEKKKICILRIMRHDFRFC
jgi:hypothetical protein